MLFFRLQVYLHNFQDLAADFQSFTAKSKHGSSFQPDNMNMGCIGYIVLRQKNKYKLSSKRRRVIVLINGCFDL